MMYYSHNLHFLSVAAGMQGNFAESLSAAQRLEANVGPHIKEMPMLDSFMCTSTLVRVRFRRWAQILTLPEPDKNSLPLTNAIWHFARGMAFANSAQAADLVKAQAELEALKQGRESVSPLAPWGNNRGRAVLKVAETMLAARLSAARHDAKSAIDLLKQAATLEDALIYSEPPDWYIPARESLGALLLAAKDYTQAESAFREDLKHHAASGRSLFGLYRALEALGKDSEAAQVYKQYQAAWTKSDTALHLEDL
jgi:hypothetical protein